ncbi:hypothetical protein Pd630_LPD14041 (plasmid) [Rhodococcus opacus PD630]|nr:hypothetical protein Pd630_LPD14041 [Rhodococcus opacus PD630]
MVRVAANRESPGPTRATTTTTTAGGRGQGIVPRIARRGVDGNDRLGRYRWNTEHTIAWRTSHRRFTIRYDRRDEHFVGLSIAPGTHLLQEQLRIDRRPRRFISSSGHSNPPVRLGSSTRGTLEMHRQRRRRRRRAGPGPRLGIAGTLPK